MKERVRGMGCDMPEVYKIPMIRIVDKKRLSTDEPSNVRVYIGTMIERYVDTNSVATVDE